MPEAFTVSNTAVLTSTITSQTVVFPAADGETLQLIIYNGAANPVFVAKAATVAVPAVTASGGTAASPGVICIAPSTSQPFSLPMLGGTLAYIAATAGGFLAITTGSGL